MQTSPEVQAIPSLHAAPSLAATPWQLPETQTSLAVQTLASSQALPSFVGWATQLPLELSQTPTVHCPVREVQSLSGPATHEPWAQASETVHGSPSSQAGPVWG